MSKFQGKKFRVLRFLPILIWIFVLAFWAVQSFQHITLRRGQILSADFVVTARIESLDQKMITVEKEWRERKLPALLKVENIELTNASVGESYLIPLERISETRYRIALISRSQKRPAIYLSTEETQSQLREILKTTK